MTHDCRCLKAAKDRDVNVVAKGTTGDRSRHLVSLQCHIMLCWRLILWIPTVVAMAFCQEDVASMRGQWAAQEIGVIGVGCLLLNSCVVMECVTGYLQLSSVPGVAHDVIETSVGWTFGVRRLSSFVLCLATWLHWSSYVVSWRAKRSGTRHGLDHGLLLWRADRRGLASSESPPSW